MDPKVAHIVLVLSLVQGPALAAAPAAAVEVSVTGFEVEGDNPLSAAETRRVLEPYRGRQSGLEGLQAATEALQQALRSRGYTFHEVTLPPQTLDGGTVKLRVTALEIGKVRVTGNEHFSEANILQSLPRLRPGIRDLNTRKLAQDLALANHHPTKQNRLRFSASPEPGKVDAEIAVSDHPVQRVFAWANNTGTPETGDTRAGVGYQHTNVFGRDHIATVTYTTSPEKPDQVKQFGAQYQIPLYGAGGIVDFLFAHSDVDSGKVAEVFDVSGRGTVIGTRYTHPFARHNNYSHEVALSLTDKLFDNEVDFEGNPLGVDVRSRPAELRYAGAWQGAHTKFDFYLGYAHNVKGGEYNNNEAYEATRSGSDTSWSAVHYGGSVSRALEGWTLIGRVDGQHASMSLIPGEQFGLGGALSVRGLKERETAGDRGYRAGVELWTPPISSTGVRALGFVEGGRVSLKNPLPGEVETDAVASAGVGVRWAWHDRLSLRLDWGQVLNGVDNGSPDASTEGDDKLHFNFAYRF